MRSLLGSLAAPRIRNDSPVPLTSRRTGGVGGFFGSTKNVTGELGAMGSVSTLFSIVNRTSNATAQVDWHLYRKAKTGKKEDRAEVTSHAMLDLWNLPNPFMPRQNFVETFQQHVDLTGESDWIVARNPHFDLPLELWPVRPDRIMPVQDPAKFLIGYVYISPDGEQVPLKLNEVIQLKMPNPLDPYRGMGPVQALLTDLDAVRYSAEWNLNFFKNSSEPGGIIEVEDRLSDDQFDEMSMRWEEQHRGVARAHRVAIIEQGKWVPNAFSMKDMQFAELRSVGRDTIMEGFGISKTALGISDGVNRAVALTAKALFAEQLTQPRLERIKGALNFRLVPMYGPNALDLEWDYDSPVPADADAENAERNSKATAAQQYVAAGYDGTSVAVALDLPAGLEWEKPAEPPPPPVIMPTPPGGDQADDTTDPAGTPDPAKLPDAVSTQQLLAEFTKAIRNAPPLGTPPEGWAAVDVAAVEAVDLGPVQAAWEAALEGLAKHWQNSVVADWIQQLVNAIRTAVGAGRGFTELTVDTNTAGAVLADAMAVFAQISAGHVVAEAAADAVTLAPMWPTAADLQAAADATATFEGQRWALTAGREAARVAGPDADADVLAEHIAAFLAEQSEAPTNTALGGALTDAQNTARIQTLRTGPVGAIYASEQMDTRTCDPCREVDGRFICTTDDEGPLYSLYPAGGYVDCLGRDRCRGTVVGVWRPNNTEESAA